MLKNYCLSNAATTARLRRIFVLASCCVVASIGLCGLAITPFSTKAAVRSGIDEALNSPVRAAPVATGYLEICKKASGSELDNRVFTFKIGNNMFAEAPVGGCSGPLEVPAGALVIEEQFSGRRISDGSAWRGGFQLIGVSKLARSTSMLTGTDFSRRQAFVNIQASGYSNTLRLMFTNQESTYYGGF